MRILLLLAAGAVVNVAVAWGCGIARVGFRAEHFWLDDRRLPGIANDLGISVDLQSQFLPTADLESYWGGTYCTLIYGADPFYIYEHVLTGLPCSTLEGRMTWVIRSPATVRVRNGLFEPVTPRFGIAKLPYRPILPGFLINTLFYAMMLGLLYLAPGRLRQVIRRRRGLCPACGYPVGTSAVCTECGAPLAS